MAKHAVALRGRRADLVVDRASAILDAGFDRVVLESPLDELSYQALRGVLPRESVAAIRLFQPRAYRQSEPDRVDLGELSRRELKTLVHLGQRSLEAADDCKSPYVLVPVCHPAFGSEAAFEMYCSLLDPLLDRADRFALKLCLTPSTRSHEFPNAAYLAAIAKEFSGAPLALWYDSLRVPRARSNSLPPEQRQAEQRQAGADSAEEELERLVAEYLPSDPARESAQTDDAEDDARAMLESTGLEVCGISLQDSQGDRDGLLPGTGDFDWATLEETIRAIEIWCLDIRDQSPELLANAREFLDTYEHGQASGNSGLSPLF